MSPRFKIPLKKYKILTHLLNQDKEKYTSYSKPDDKEMLFRINFDDLVHTLKINPDFYHRPIVELDDYGFMVRGNNIFFEAGKKAGLNYFICDVNIRTLDDRHMSQFQLLDVEPEMKPFRVDLIFFIDLNITSHENITEHLNQALQKKGYGKRVFFNPIEFGVFEFKITRAEENPESAFEAAKELISHYGFIRSINGLIENVNYKRSF